MPTILHTHSVYTAPNRTSKTMLSLDSSPSQKTSDLLTSQKVRTPVHDEQHILEESNVERSEQDEMNWYGK